MISVSQKWTMVGVAAMLGGALMWQGSARRAQAQDEAQNGSGVRSGLGIRTPRVILSRDQAAKKFLALLDFFDTSVNARGFSRTDPDAAMMSSFARRSETEVLGALLIAMARQLRAPEQVVQVQSETADTATVVVQTAPAPATRPLVLVREGEGWGVDVAETYAQWNHLEGAAKTDALALLAEDYGRARENARRSSCQSNLKQIALGIAQYTQDYDERLPLAKPWIDILQPYVKSEQLFTCPAVTDPKGYGYAFNSRLSSKPLASIDSVSQTVSVYETTVLKRNAYGMGEFPAFRHLGGANYAFADGHVKWFDKSTIPSLKLKP